MIPLDKLKIVIDFLKGQGTASIGQVARAVYDILGWVLSIVAPASGTASAQFAVPPWLIPILFDIGKKLLEKLLSGKAEARAATVKVAAAPSKAKKLEKWVEEIQGQAA